MKCSKCGSENAYVSLLFTECQNLDCEDFTWAQCLAAQKELERIRSKSIKKYDPNPPNEDLDDLTLSFSWDETKDPRTSEQVLKDLTYSSVKDNKDD